jgi:predicted peptidase
MVRVNDGNFSSLSARPSGTTNTGEGYYERLPVGYGNSGEERFPLIIYLHGSGEAGANLSVLNVSQDPTRPTRSLTGLINPEQGGGTQNFVVLFPQRCASIVTPQEIHSFIDYAINTYKVDATRVYLVGLSAGGSQIWKYLEVYQDQVAAAATLAGADITNDVCLFKNIPVWAFHSSDDPNVPVSHSIGVVNRLNNCLPAPLERHKLTVFATGGHVIDEVVLPLTALNQGLATYDSYTPDIYTWFLEHHR